MTFRFCLQPIYINPNAIEFQVTLQRLEDKQAPKLEDMTQYDFQYILGLSQTQRHKYYKFLYKSQNSDAAARV